MPAYMRRTWNDRKGDGDMADGTKAVKWEELSPDDRLKYEIAEELGLLEAVQANGWKSLSARDTGRIGGLMTKRKREQKCASQA